MKKLLSVLIAISIIICQLSVVSSAWNDETTYVSLDKFTSSFVEMLHSSELECLSDESEPKLSSSATTEQPETKDNENDTDNIEHSNRLIVKSTERLDALDSVGYVYGYNDLHILQFDNRESFEKAYSYYSALACVEYVEEDMYLTEAVVDDGVVVESVADYPTGVQSNLFGYSNAKSGSDGYSVDIAVIDSGVQHDHDFLKGRVVDSGFNAISDNGTAYDDRGHGTHVAGIIVANTLSNVTVHAYKALSATGSGSASQVSLAIDAAIEDGVDIINLSMQMKGTSSVLYEAVLKAYNAGICVIVSAGNSGVDLASNPYSPGSFTETISVMSCSNSRRILSSSNYGTPCDFAAPGENILSTYINNTYKISTGTSMAAPFICAAAAYELAVDNTLSPDEIATALSAKAKWCYGSPSGKCVYPATKTTVSGTTETPAFELASCSFLGQMKVSLSCGTENVDIFYNINGEETFTEYTEPFYITETSEINSFAVANGKYNSATASVTYTLVDGDASDFIVDETETLIAYNGSAASVNVPSYINGKRVSNVGDGAFSGNNDIIDVVFEASLTNIGENAFAGCNNLTSVTAPNVTYIGKNAFKDCVNLSNVKSYELKNIGDGAFSGCSLLTAVMHDKVETIGANAFENTGNFTSFSSVCLTEIGNEAFKNSGLTTLGISSATTIGDYAFSGCSSITEAVLTCATSVGKGAFENCVALTTVSAPEITNVSEYCFDGCEKLSTVSVTSATLVDSYAFRNCSALDKYTGFSAVEKINSYAFENAALSSISSTVLTSIEPYAFEGCLNLAAVTLNGLKSIDLSSFTGASNISYFTFNNATELILPEGGVASVCPSVNKFVAPKITSLPDNAFNGCTELTTQTLTALTSVGANAFKQTSLTEVNFQKLTTAGEGAFADMARLIEIDLPALTAVSVGMFKGDTAVETVILDNVTDYPTDFFVKDIFPNIVTFSSDDIRTIHPQMFKDCTKLSDVQIDEVGSIGYEAFKNCALDEISLHVFSIDGVDAFDGNPLTSVSLYYLEELSCDFFGSSKSTIKNITMDSVTNVGTFTFEDFSNLESLYMRELPIVPSDFVSGHTTLKNVVFNNATAIEAGAFSDCTSLEKVSVSYVSTIGENAFNNCSNLKRFSNGAIKELDATVFKDCVNLEELVLRRLEILPTFDDGTSFFGTLTKLKDFEAGNVEEIPAHAFVGCSSLQSVSFYNSISVGHHAFYGCSKLTSVYFYNIESIGDYAFYGTSLENFDFPGLVNIGEYAFYKTKIVDFDGQNVKTIGKGAFAECASLEDVSLAYVTSIPEYAFTNNIALTEVSFGQVTAIGDKAFKNCSQLSSCYFNEQTIELGDEALYGCSSIDSFNKFKFSSIGSYALYGCTQLKLNYELPDLKKVSENAFEGYSMDLLILENVEEIYDVPDDCIVLVGTDVKAGAIPSDTTATIYSPAGSVASQYCIANGINYVEFNETNPIFENTEKYISAYDSNMTFEARGFNLVYKWYGCNNIDMSDSVLLKTQSNNSLYSSFVPFSTNNIDSAGDYKYYYCVATSTENDNVVKITSNLVRNTYTYVATQNYKTEIDYYNGYIFTDEKDIDAVKENIHFEEGCCEFVPTYSQNGYDFYGTGSSVNVYVEDEIKHTYTLVLDGDVNGDGYVDVLDCAIIANVSNGLAEFENENYQMAGDWFDEMAGVSAIDYQAVVNKALS